MDARATLAIAAVVRSVVDTADSKVAVLPSPEGVPPERFKALSGFAETAGGTNALFELARLVNQKIVPPVVDDDTSIPLWSLVYDILWKDGKAGKQDDTDEGDEYRDARKLILVDDESGIGRPSPAYLAYQEMADQWFCLQQDIGGKKLELSLKPADDPGRPALEQTLAKLLHDSDDLELRWEAEGQRSKIEYAMQVVNSAGARSPERQWTNWQKMLLPFVNTDTGQPSLMDPLTEAPFAATSISPGGIDESASSWTKMSLSAAEVAKLVADVPESLAKRFNPGGSDLEIEKLDFEWTTAGIVRPWLDRAMFSSSAWCFADAGRMVSDGADPPQGEWPYLATGIVLVRSVTAVFRQPPPTPPTPPAPHPHHDFLHDVLLHHHAALDHVLQPAAPSAPAVLIAEPAIAVLKQSAPQPQFVRGRFFRVQGVPAAAEAAPVKAQPAFAMLRERAFIRRQIQPDLIAATVSTTADVTPAPAETVADPIMIFGLICRRLPKTPNPDPTLFD